MLKSSNMRFDKRLSICGYDMGRAFGLHENCMEASRLWTLWKKMTK